MVIFHNWTVDGDIFTADISISQVTDVFRAQWDSHALKMKTSIPLDRSNYGLVLRAFACLCVRYEDHKIKLGDPTSIAWG